MSRRKLLIATLAIIGIFIFTGIGMATISEPGSEQDPLVTQSYVEKRIEQIKYYIDQKIEEVLGTVDSNKAEIEKLINENKELKDKIEAIENIKQTGSYGLEVVELKNSQKLIGKAGTEIILRGGQAKAIAGELGGLSDVTGATDIKMNQLIPANHLLIIPRSDGRGVYAEKYAIFMVRGEYEIVEN
ncbi:hypothetical protein [Thermohalobacter berrensis]|uniref:Uncharacterized protein n=1 Tax=Thermohalobacter berrensis TaxID=99594 RepID=A0A419SXT1_9FIRM|nr:hypothetical protein [Thermohalobacter berrensis]RKD30073.1 hypothetical protein BET03_05045 [Thermohalobacter berrensis]